MRNLRLWLPGLTVLQAVATGCIATPEPTVTIENEYPASSGLVIYQALWQSVSFDASIAPGAASAPTDTLSASDNTAYALLAPGWDPASNTQPSSLVVVQSREGYSVSLGQSLEIPVDDTTFAGNCAAGSFLTQEQADFVTQRVFQSAFVSRQYDPTTCTTTPAVDGGP